MAPEPTENNNQEPPPDAFVGNALADNASDADSTDGGTDDEAGAGAENRSTAEFINKLYSKLNKGRFPAILTWGVGGRVVVKDGELLRKKSRLICGTDFNCFAKKTGRLGKGFSTLAKTETTGVFYDESFAAGNLSLVKRKMKKTRPSVQTIEEIAVGKVEGAERSIARTLKNLKKEIILLNFNQQQ
ncbi:hypothetical protein BVC80_9091g41 [Macleaya cordata]|uniref:Uncharacterized protein n=1 Tax=Macleaya cordata TaxID=56857 RepID=A0A200PWF0_MACCD|nr:hypothetical protein BVC80_9091g41 [Macleaya cordata]